MLFAKSAKEAYEAGEMTVLEGILVDVNVVVETDVVDGTDGVVRVDAADSVKREDSTCVWMPQALLNVTPTIHVSAEES
jgi:hypothetical protein